MSYPRAGGRVGGGGGKEEDRGGERGGEGGEEGGEGSSGAKILPLSATHCRSRLGEADIYPAAFNTTNLNSQLYVTLFQYRRELTMGD